MRRSGMRTKNFVLGVLVGIFAFSEVAFAQMLAQAPKRELLLFEEIPIVTSAARRPQPITEATSAISVITAEDIKNLEPSRIWDLFRRVPGVDVATRDGRSGYVAPRGFAGDYTRYNQVLIDGRSVYSPLFGGTDWEHLPLFAEEIERIEVIRGPNATLYGSNAFTGVINIITKKPEDTKGVFLKEKVGNFEYNQSILGYGANVGKLDYRVMYG